jgi:peptide/nickel transport system substrate-binding protein
MVTQRKSVWGILILASTLALAACSGGSSTTSATPQVLTYANPATFPDLDPSTGFSNDSAVVSNVYETLTRYGVPGSTPAVQPLLATSWTQSADGLTWTFKLRSGAKFHDGTPVNAAAVKFSIDRTKKLAQGGAFVWDAVKSVTAVDDLTVQFALKYQAPLDLIASSGYAAWIMSPTAAIGKDNAWFNAGHDAGSGPYMIDTYEKDQRVILKKFKDYWRGWKAGQFDTMILKVAADASARQQLIESGGADYTYTIPTENLPALKSNSSVRIVANPSYQNMEILLNNVKLPTKSKLLRQALSMSFPYQVAIDSSMAGYATQARGIVPASLIGSGISQVPQYSYDLAKAKSLLAQAGFPKGGFSLDLTYSTGDTLEKQSAELWKAELAKLGITLNIKAMAWEAQWALAKGDPTKAQDAFMFYWWPAYATPYDFMFNLFHSEKSPNFNLGYYNNSKYDSLIDTANTLISSDRTKAMADFIEADKMLVDDAAAIFVLDEQNIHVVSSSLKGFVDNPAYPHVLFAYDVTR